jgi:hypothetical protein
MKYLMPLSVYIFYCQICLESPKNVPISLRDVVRVLHNTDPVFTCIADPLAQSQPDIHWSIFLSNTYLNKIHLKNNNTSSPTLL